MMRSLSVRLDVRRVDFDADTAWPIRSTDSTRRAFCASLRISRPTTPRSGPWTTSTIMPFANQRTRIVLQLAADQQPDAVELVLGNRRGLAFERHDVHDAGALQDRQRVVGIEAREAVAGKQRPVDLLLPILPAAPARDGRQKRFDVLALELLADDLLVPRARPDRVPLSGRDSLDGDFSGRRSMAAAAPACCSMPSS